MEERRESPLASVSHPVGLLTCFPLLVSLVSGTGGTRVGMANTNQVISDSQPVGNLEHNETEPQVNDRLFAKIDCTDPYISLNRQTRKNGFTRITFSTPDRNVAYTSLSCGVNLTSLPDYVVSAVLLEHSLCDGGVFVLLADYTKSRRWDVCSIWRAPGPDFTSSSRVVSVRIELSDVIDPCVFTISIIATEKPREAELTLRYLSATEGKYLS